MSDQGKPDDPWARWRKPDGASEAEVGAPERAADSEKSASVSEAPVRPATVEAAAAPQASEPAPAGEVPPEGSSRPSGTLSVRKVVKAADVAAEKPRARSGGKSFEKREGAGGKAFSKPGERRDERPRDKFAGEVRAAGKPRAHSGDARNENPWGKPASDRRAEKPRGSGNEVRSQNPWGKPASETRAPGKSSAQRGGTRGDGGPRGENPWARSDGTVRSQAREDSVNAAASNSAVPQSAKVPQGEAQSGVRLSKVMSERGLCSRREADLWISRGWVFVDGVQISELGSRIDPSADISISQDAKKDQAKQMTIILHKPVGYVSGQPEPGFTPAVTLISAETQMVQSGDPEFKPWMLRGLAPAGRLDIDSTGLLVLTQDGRVAKKLIGEDSEIEKEYLVRVSGEMIPGGLELLNHGLELDGKPLKPARVKQLNEDQLHFILKEGKKRQIRRMCELVGLRVVGLKRVRIGRVRLGDLPMGQWRFLRADEAF